MIFTREDILKIQNALLQLGRKDSEFEDANTPLNSEDYISILQDGINKKVSINNLLSTLGLLKKDDFINVSDRYDEYHIQLSEAITIIAENKRKRGLVITFQDLNGDWKIYQFKGVLNQWDQLDLWEDLFDWGRFVIDSILPDEEDLTKSLPDENGNSYLSLKDRAHGDGMGYVILRKNKSFAEQVTLPNTIYEIRYNFDLNGEEITIPKDCVLYFIGGSIKNGTLYGNNTIINSIQDNIIFNNIIFTGTFIDKFYLKWAINLSTDTDITDVLKELLEISPFKEIIIDKDGYYNIHDTINIPDYKILNMGEKLDVSAYSNGANNKYGIYLNMTEDVTAFRLNNCSKLLGGCISYNNLSNVTCDAIIIENTSITKKNIFDVICTTSLYGKYTEGVMTQFNRGIHIIMDSEHPVGVCNCKFESTIRDFYEGFTIDGWKSNSNNDLVSWCTSVYYNGTIWGCVTALNIEGGHASMFDGMIQARGSFIEPTPYIVKLIAPLLYFNMYIWDLNQQSKIQHILVGAGAIHINEVMQTQYGGIIDYADKAFRYANISKIVGNYGSIGDASYNKVNGVYDNLLLGADYLYNVSYRYKGQPYDSSAIKNIFREFGKATLEFSDTNGGVLDIEIDFGDNNLKHISEYFVVSSYLSLVCSIEEHIYGTDGKLYTYIHDMNAMGGNVNTPRTALVGYVYQRNTYKLSENNDYNFIKKIKTIIFHIQIPANVSYIHIDGLVAKSSLGTQEQDYLFKSYGGTLAGNIQFKNKYLNEETYENRGVNTLQLPFVKYYPSAEDMPGAIVLSPRRENIGFIPVINRINKDSSGITSILDSIDMINDFPSNLDYRDAGYKCIKGSTLAKWDGYRWVKYGYNLRRVGTTNNRPTTLTDTDTGYIYYDTSINKSIYWNGSKWVDENNVSIDALKFGTFEQKPTIASHNIPIGYKYFCTDKQSVEGGTDGIEIIHKGNNTWVDALGRELS